MNTEEILKRYESGEGEMGKIEKLNSAEWRK